MAFDFAARVRDAAHSPFATKVRGTRSWLLMAACGWALASPACSSFSGGSSSPVDAAGGGHAGTGAGTGGSTGTGGNTAGTGGSSVGGAVGTGGSSPDAAVDAPITDAPSTIDGAGPCMMPDGGDASGDCCPDDPMKDQPGVCGCGMPDVDTDQDGTLDCQDLCPFDISKTAPGMCGCGLPETDTDGDGVPDCIDLCPKDRTRTQPGVCGCGIPDTAPLCLAHRYSFSDNGTADAGTGDGGAAAGTTVVRDSVGTANGTAMGVTLTGTGSVTLAGGTSNQYIQLPAGIISSLGNSATFETWLTWPGTGGLWQRIFDFGSSSAGAGMQGSGETFIFLTPQSGTGGTILVSFLTALGGVNEVPGTAFLTAGSKQHIAVVIDNASHDGGGPSLSLYLNGVFTMRTALTNQLSQIDDVNNWLGRSQFTPDPGFAGTYDEFRIYSAALTDAQIAASFAKGPDMLPTP